MSSELCSFYIVRHFDKVTARNRGKFPNCFSAKERKKYNDNNYGKNPKILINPYICNGTSKRVISVASALRDVTIDYVISSPFLRTIQTALDLINFKIGDDFIIDIKNREVYVDYGLSECFKYINFLEDKPVNINVENIYRESIEFIYANDLKRRNYKYKNVSSINENPLILEKKESCSRRFFETFKKIQECSKFMGKNILIVTHGASLSNWYSSNTVFFNYGDVFMIKNLEAKPQKIEIPKFEQKYIKYKTKYLMLKKNDKNL